MYMLFFLADVLNASVKESVSHESGIPVACTLFHTPHTAEASTTLGMADSGSPAPAT